MTWLYEEGRHPNNNACKVCSPAHGRSSCTWASHTFSDLGNKNKKNSQTVLRLWGKGGMSAVSPHAAELQWWGPQGPSPRAGVHIKQPQWFYFIFCEEQDCWALKAEGVVPQASPACWIGFGSFLGEWPPPFYNPDSTCILAPFNSTSPTRIPSSLTATTGNYYLRSLAKLRRWELFSGLALNQ